MERPAALKQRPSPEPLLAWAPSGLMKALGGVLVVGPPPVSVERVDWLFRVKVRLQGLINSDPNPVETIKWRLDDIMVLPTLREPKSAWADILFQTSQAISATLAEADQAWPAVVKANDLELAELLSETTLEEWLGLLNTR